MVKRIFEIIKGGGGERQQVENLKTCNYLIHFFEYIKHDEADTRIFNTIEYVPSSGAMDRD